MQIGMANSTSADADQDVVRPKRRQCDILNHQRLLRSVEDGGFHGRIHSRNFREKTAASAATRLRAGLLAFVGQRLMHANAMDTNQKLGYFRVFLQEDLFVRNLPV
jgi:hypothetical protein